MTHVDDLQSADAFQEELRRHRLFSLQGWQQTSDPDDCALLLTDLVRACGDSLLVTGSTGDQDGRLVRVAWRVGRLTLESVDEDGASRPPLSFRLFGAAVSRFAIVLLGVPGESDLPGGVAGPCALVWHRAFRLTPDHIAAYFSHFGRPSPDAGPSATGTMLEPLQ